MIEVVGSLLDVRKPQQFQLSVPLRVSREYNEGFERMKVTVRSLHAGERERLSYRQGLQGQHLHIYF